MHQVTNLRPMRAARIRLGLTLLQLAKKCEEHGVTISEGALSRIERGQFAGRPETRAALAAVLGLDAATDFEKTETYEPADSPAADGAMSRVRNAERTVSDELPKLPDTAVERFS